MSADAIAGGVSAGLNFLSGMLNRDAQSRFNDSQVAQAEANRGMQMKFAQEGIRWKVNDARDAGIHPLYALGANTVSYSPVSLGTVPETGMGAGLAAAGQDISRAIQATRTSGERASAFSKSVQDLQLTNMGLQNELLASQIAKLRSSQVGPPMPGYVPEADKPEDRPQLLMDGKKWPTDSSTTNMDDYSKRYGDEGLPSWIIPLMIMYQDAQATYGKPATWPSQMVDQLWSRAKQDVLYEADNAKRFLGRYAPRFDWSKYGSR